MNFNEKVYRITSKIPKGCVSTYKEISEALNCKAYRSVGNALNKNPYPSNKVPCHRVIKSSGEIGGFAEGIGTKINMLRREGIIIKNNKIDLQKYFHHLK